MKTEGLLRLRLFLLVVVAVVVSTSAFSTSQQGIPILRRQRTHQHRHRHQHQHQHQLHQRQSTALAFGVDPSHLSDLVSSLLADGGEVAGIMTDPASMTDVAAAAPVEDNGWFGFLTIPIMGLLQVIHTGVSSVAGSNSWGISIIVLTILIKAVTFPLTKTQLESTTRMQAMQPAMKQIQTKYQSNPEVMNQKMAEFYQQNNINPLAGCLPSLLQIPIFIGLYRAVLDLAKENKLNEPFLFLPSLEGPTYGADPATANDWIFKGLYVSFRFVLFSR
jgi:YidC/Oxa1 family membrane protein insertase